MSLELAEARQRISEALQGQSFLEKGYAEDHIHVNLLPARGPSAEVRSTIDSLAYRRVAMLEDLANLVVSQMRKITSSFAHEALKFSSSFLQTGKIPSAVNIHVGIAAPYPRVAGIVARMERGFDLLETQDREYALSAIKRLETAETQMLKEALNKVKETSFMQQTPQTADAWRARALESAVLTLNVHPPEEDTVEIKETLEGLNKEATIRHNLRNEAFLKQIKEVTA